MLNALHLLIRNPDVTYPTDPADSTPTLWRDAGQPRFRLAGGRTLASLFRFYVEVRITNYVGAGYFKRL